MFKWLPKLIFPLLIVSPLPAFSAEGDWQVIKATGQVMFTLDRTNWAAVKPGLTIPNKAWVSTGPRGRAMLKRGVESVTFHPDTMAGIITTNLGTRQTEIVQPQGTLDLEIEKRAAPHTRVETPYLAAIVKGTIFSVSVSKKAAAVSVDRGLVNVRAFRSGQQADVGPGQSANVRSGAGMKTAGKTSAPAITAAPPSFGIFSVPSVPAAAPDMETPAATNAASATAGAQAKGPDAKGAASGKGPDGGKGSDGGKGPGGAKGSDGGKGGDGGKGSGGGPGGPGGGHDGPGAGKGGDGPGNSHGPGGKGPGGDPGGPGGGHDGPGGDNHGGPGGHDGPGGHNGPDGHDGHDGPDGHHGPGGHGDHGGGGPGGKSGGHK